MNKVMKANAPKKIYIFDNPILDFTKLSVRQGSDDIEYIRKDAFIEKAVQFLYDYNQKQVLKHGARAILSCGEFTINVDEFRKYMEGE